MSSTPSINFGLVACNEDFLYNLGSEEDPDPPAAASKCSRGLARNESPLSSVILTKLK